MFAFDTLWSWLIRAAVLSSLVLIIGLLAGMAVKGFMGQTDKAAVITTKADLATLHEAVLLFKMDTKQYPTEEEGLIVLVEEPMDITGWQPGGYLKSTEVPLDAWDNDFIYIRNPESGKPFVIISYGADGDEGGEGDYAEDLAATMLATTLGIPFDPDLAWDARKQVYKASKYIFKTRNICQSSEGNKHGKWTTVVAAAIMLFE